MIHLDERSSNSAHEQMLGLRLAADHTRETGAGAEHELELDERVVSTRPSASIGALAETLVSSGCDALVGVLTAPLSEELAEWADKAGVLYLTANNRPSVWNGRRHVFHIGVPSEITGRSVIQHILAQGIRKAAILYRPGPPEAYNVNTLAAESAAKSAAEEGMETRLQSLELGVWDGSNHTIDDEAVCIFNSDVPKIAELVTRLRSANKDALIVLSRSMLCRDFIELAGDAGKGCNVVDLFFRSDDASAEERALMRGLAATDARLVATANHGFGWDCLRLTSKALREAETDAAGQVALLEGLDKYQGATGPFAFSSQDHNGRRRYNPTTIALLSKAGFVRVSSLDRTI